MSLWLAAVFLVQLPSAAPQAAPAGVVGAAPVASLSPTSKRVPKAKEVKAPRVPDGVQPCDSPLAPSIELPRGMGETIRYVVDVNGLSVGTIDFRIERRGTFDGKPVTEYRSLFKLDSLVSTFLPVQGRAAALVPDRSFAPLAAMNHYTLDKNEFEESATFKLNGTSVASKRKKNGKASDDERVFPGPATDFVSGFYMLRTLPAGSSGCSIIYGNQRAYTIWIRHDGKERIKTPVGFRDAERYLVTYASDKSKSKADGTIWIGGGADRLPYKAEISGQHKLEARIHLYETGQ